MKTDTLIFQTTPTVTIATNTFINVPVILRFENTNLIEFIQELELGFTTQIPIYHPDGTYLAKIKGTRSYPTEEGKKAGVIIEKFADRWVCKMGKQILFEINHHSGDYFRMVAELFTPEGYFVKCNDSASDLIDSKGSSLNVGGLIMGGNTIAHCATGIWLRKDGSCSFG